MASSLSLQTTLLRSNFIGQNNLFNRPQNHRPHSLIPKESKSRIKPCAKFDLFEILGGRGLCNGEKGIEKELKRDINTSESKEESSDKMEASSSTTSSTSVPENAFEKEMMGLTGGFPGGETGLKKFVEQNPPPKKQPNSSSDTLLELTTSKKPKPPELPLLMPGMIAIVSNPNSPYHMYCGIVQRITDGKAAVLFEGGIWDRLITFRLEELQQREKGPPGKNPRSVIIEQLAEREPKPEPEPK